MNKKPIALIILDGWGERKEKKGNAIAMANTPTIDNLNKYYPKVLLHASGEAVGLPKNISGNSRVGHLAIGTGQNAPQYLLTINKTIKDKTFFTNKTLLKTINTVKKNNSSLHLLGLVSDGSVHSHFDHLLALLKLAKKHQLKNVFIHAITDGRDTDPKNASKYLDIIDKNIKKLKTGKLATISGRYYAMDRNNNWNRIEKSFQAMIIGNGIKEKTYSQAIKNQYKRDLEDEILEPINLVDKKNNPIGLIKNKDAVICFNYRKDRSKQITQAFSQIKFNKFKNKKRPLVYFTSFAKYSKDQIAPAVFPDPVIKSRLGEILSQANKRQLRIAETEKFAHITYFFNGGIEKPFKNEDRILVPSKNIPNYAYQPEMSAKEITSKLIKNLSKKEYDFILLNYANPDMVGHTGDLQAGIKAVECVDVNLKIVIDKILSLDGCLLITADHGNAEKMINPKTNKKEKSHTTSLVPMWFVTSTNKKIQTKALKYQSTNTLIDIAPTILNLLKIKKPKIMPGKILFK